MMTSRTIEPRPPCRVN